MMTFTQDTEYSVDSLLQTAIQLHQQGKLDAAQPLYQQILIYQPEHIDALYLNGMIAYQKGLFDDAFKQLSQARAVNPKLAAIHVALGNIFRDQQNYEQALEYYREALELEPQHADAHYNLGIAYQEQNELDLALEEYKHAIKSNPEHPAAWINLGSVLKAMDHIEQAIGCYNHALRLQPNHVTALFNLAVVYNDLEQFDLAVDFYQRTLAIQPNYVMAAFNLGIALRSMGRLEEAVSWFNHVLALEPHRTGALQNLGATYQELGHIDAADECYRKALDYNAELPEVLYNRSLITLARGDYTNGWKAYEWRWQGAFSSRAHLRHFTQPQWQGEDIAGQTLLVYAEQGLGDTIQFIRYIPLLIERGIEVIVDCQPQLVRLLQTIPGVKKVFSAGQLTPDHPTFDWQCPLMSLPAAFDTTLETIPQNIPYLQADPSLTQTWTERLAKQISADQPLKVGLVWAGNPRRFSLQLNLIDRRRSLQLQQLAPLAQCKHISFISLQIGESATEEPPVGLKLYHFTDQIKDFSDTAALIANLDLIISVDTSVAHLAGAMGKPIWLLSRHDACWRWLLARTDSPWYPSLRIFRQAKPGEWQPVIEQITQLLFAQPKK